MAYNILLLGAGGREHALAWKIKESNRCKQLFIAPGNPGTASLGTNVAIDSCDFEGLKQFCIDEQISIVVVGPELPLVQGIYDFFSDDASLHHVMVIGPSAVGAQLEGSKSFSKSFMQRHQIPTAAYREFTREESEMAIAYVGTHSLPVVLKADGLAAGKGVIIALTHEEAREEIRNMLEGKFGAASHKVVVEEFMQGIEFSVFLLTDGKDYVVLPVAKDYKRIGEGDTGLNTGGMGVVSPPPFVTAELMDKVKDSIIIPTLNGLQADGIIYKGFLYIGLMNTPCDVPKVVEYNCRMGDPETQAVMMRLQSDIVALFEAVHLGSLSQLSIHTSAEVAVTVVMAAGGYPEDFKKGNAIQGIDEVHHAQVFQAGTTIKDGKLVTNGGRVLSVNALGNTLADALDLANNAALQINYKDKYYRKDIGFEFFRS
jgi:phosphoribosylamine--glycine ligase